MTWAVFQRNAYQAARSWGMAPSEFWRLPVADWWAELDWHIAETRRLKLLADEAKGGGKKTGSAFTAAQWEDARRKHREKMAKK